MILLVRLTAGPGYTCTLFLKAHSRQVIALALRLFGRKNNKCRIVIAHLDEKAQSDGNIYGVYCSGAIIPFVYGSVTWRNGNIRLRCELFCDKFLPVVQDVVRGIRRFFF